MVAIAKDRSGSCRHVRRQTFAEPIVFPGPQSTWRRREDCLMRGGNHRRFRAYLHKRLHPTNSFPSEARVRESGCPVFARAVFSVVPLSNRERAMSALSDRFLASRPRSRAHGSPVALLRATSPLRRAIEKPRSTDSLSPCSARRAHSIGQSLV